MGEQLTDRFPEPDPERVLLGLDVIAKEYEITVRPTEEEGLYVGEVLISNDEAPAQLTEGETVHIAGKAQVPNEQRRDFPRRNPRDPSQRPPVTKPRQGKPAPQRSFPRRPSRGPARG